MSGLDKKHLAIINIIFAIGDVIVCLAFVMMFTQAAVFFQKWWLTLFGFVPLLLYNSHGIIIDTQNAKNTQKEVDGNGEP